MKTILSVFLIILLMTMTSCGNGANSIDTEGSSGLSQNAQSTIKGNLTFKDKDGKVLLDKSDIISAQKYYDKNHDRYSIMISTNSAGNKKVSDFTKAMIGQQIFIYLDDDLITSPYVPEQITNSSLAIGGDFSEEEVDMLCSKINNGE